MIHRNTAVSTEAAAPCQKLSLSSGLNGQTARASVCASETAFGSLRSSMSSGLKVAGGICRAAKVAARTFHGLMTCTSCPKNLRARAVIAAFSPLGSITTALPS
ncbi:hypothetical protein AKL17_2p0001 (plasmid) [Frigidibacter mobilis]|uniref:Uncharacterized protein n=1 Tax=Frigidibacter mobilis TaxID=1335048 RepID=A0A161GN07_9RHOB|nr:hypothetical protein AKL17_2p0001 [Frigidibacter mobilis]